MVQSTAIIRISQLVLIPFVLIGTVFAELEGDHEGKSGKENPHKEKLLKRGGRGIGDFFRSDLNKDRVISFDEFSEIERLRRLSDEQKRKLYDFLDKDGDSVLQPEELKPKDPPWLSELRRDFVKLDIDQSGGLSLVEFSAIHFFQDHQRFHIERFFDEVDKNKDTVIGSEEALKFKKRGLGKRLDFTKYDINESGGLDMQEYSRLPMVHKIPEDTVQVMFDRIDTDKDGELSKREMRRSHQQRSHKRRPH